MTAALTEAIDSYPLSPTQAGMLHHALSEAGSGIDIEQIVMDLREPIDERHFVHAWHVVAQRHTILRTRFRWEDVPEARQEVVEAVEIPIASVNWSALDPAQAEALFTRQLAADRLNEFDLSRAPIMRLFIARFGAEEFRIVWTFHHALLDGRSFPCVLREVFAVHEALRRGEAVSPVEHRPYREYIEWRQAIDIDAAEAYWRGALSGFGAATPLGFGAAGAAGGSAGVDGAAFGARQVRLSGTLTSALRGRAVDSEVSINTLLLGAWALLLSRCSGESDVVFGSTRSGRSPALDPNRERVGLFINTLPVRVAVNGDCELVAWLQTLRKTLVQSRPFEQTPLVKVQSWSSVARGQPLFESLVVYDHRTLDGTLRALGGAWAQRRFEYIGQTNYPLAVLAYGDDEMLLRIEYSRHRFTEAAIERMLGHLTTLLAGIALGQAKRLKDLKLLSAIERARLLSAGDEVRRYARGPALQQRFERQVERTPEATALTAFGSGGARVELSYRELNRRANGVAHRLRALGVEPSQLVGLRTERNAELVIGLLGILKAGAAYLPLDPVYPQERVAFMLEDSGVAVVLTQSSMEAELAGVTVICLDVPLTGTALADANLPASSGADDLAYVIYTSGSTGKPKGARISHHNVCRLFDATEAWYGFNERDVCTLFHSYAFDFSVWELWGALLHGGRVVVVPAEASRSTEEFLELLLQEQVTVLNQTPTAFRLLTDAIASRPKAAFALRYIVFGGEALEFQSLRGWFERYGDTSPRLINMYGITETTVHVSYRPLSRADLAAGTGSTIGVPLPDLRIYILDPQREPAPIGVAGEMFVAGAGVGLGYLNRPELSAQRFLPDPFDAEPDARMYRTGDLARRLDNGDIEYLGRIDQQVKIRGFRIELGEIESVVSRHPRVGQAAVVAREDVLGDKRLVAYLVATGDESGLADELRQSLRSVVPDYMVPAHFVFLPALPLTQNGKLDRQALPAPATVRPDDAKAFVAPRSAIEQAIAAIWQAVLRVDRVGVDDHFFELGGDSILSIQVIARCRQQGLRFTPKDLFIRPTIAQLAEVVQVASTAKPAPTGPAGGAVALTPIQHWFFEQRFADPHHWNQAFMFEVPADVQRQHLDAAVRGLHSRHPALRLRYRQDADGSWHQRCESSEATQPVKWIDLSTVAAPEQGAAIELHACAEQSRFDLAAGPVFLAVHFGLGTSVPGRLLVAIHHLVVDGVSWRILREDLESLYLASAAGASASLPEPTSSLQAWSVALHEHAQSAAVQGAFAHWNALATRQPLTLAHHAAGQAPFAAAGTLITRLSHDDTRGLLQRLPAAFQTQINDALLTALALTLHRGTGSRQLTIDLEGHGREHIADEVDVSRTVGWFTTLYPIALDVDPGVDAVANLLSIRGQLERVPDRGLSYGLLRYLSPDAAVRQALHNAPASPVLFNYLGQFDAVVADSTMFTFARESAGPWRSPRARRTHALEIVAMVRDGQLEIAWHHDADDRHAASVAEVAQGMVDGLRELVASAGRPRRRAPMAADFPLSRLDDTALSVLGSRYPRLEDVYPLTPMQRLFFAMEASRAHLGFEQWHFRLDGSVDAGRLRRAIEHVIERHTMLRTCVVADPGAEPLLIVSTSAPLPWSDEDWRDDSAAEQSARLADLLAADARSGFDLATAPLMRVALRRVADEAHHFIWSTHHLCIDGWSWPIVFGDVSRAYAALEAGREPARDAALPFRRYVAWLAETAPRSEEFWKVQLAGFSAPTPFRLSGPGAPIGSDAENDPFAEIALSLPAAATGALLALARSAHVTPSAIVNGAWALLLAHYSGATTVVLGAAFSGRPSEIDGIESMVGPCVNNLPLRLAADPAAGLRAWLDAIQKSQFEISQHQYAPLEQIQQWAGVPWRHRLFDSLVVFQNYAVDAAARGIGAGVRSTLISAPEATNYPLTLAVSVAAQLRIRLIYKPDALARDDVAQYAADLSTALLAMAAAETSTLRDVLALLPAASRGRAGDFAAALPAVHRGAFAAPSSDAEMQIATVWRELFGVDDISLDDNFFDLGGHSLLLVQAHARLRASLHAELPIVALLQYPTVRSLAHHLNRNSEGDGARAAGTAAERARKQREALVRQRALAGRP